MASTPTLPLRYEIRQLQPEHIDWATAIFSHSNIFHSSAFTAIYAGELTSRCYAMFKTARYLVAHQIQSGHSLGVFDKEWKPTHAETTSATAANGKLLWNLDDPRPDGQTLADQMDFPLASIALAYDSFVPPDPAQIAPLHAALPAVASMYAELERRDPRDDSAAAAAAGSWRATAPRQVLFRNGTSTHRAHEGRGLMKATAHQLMRRAADAGFRAIQIEIASDAVIHVWSNPPPPFRSELIAEIDSYSYEEEDEHGNKTHPLRPSKQRLQKVWVSLVEG